MRKLLQTRNLGLLILFLGAAPFALAQASHRLPEGGSDLTYLVLAGGSCIGAIWYRIRR
jgi:hypothetical protein